jgi:methionyl-tRNA formyltransferase
VLRTLDEALYYFLYRRFLTRTETSKLQRLVAAAKCSPRRPLSDIPQLQPTDIRSPDLQRTIESMRLDAMFAMCIDVFLPAALINAPKHGSFLWHEGITPEYRGVYSPFWALVNRDYSRLGYTLLKMNAKLDAGDVYVQGPVESVDLERDWHSYIGHKAILDSLPATLDFLRALEGGVHRPIVRESAHDGYYSYPTASGLLKIAAQRLF